MRRRGSLSVVVSLLTIAALAGGANTSQAVRQEQSVSADRGSVYLPVHCRKLAVRPDRTQADCPPATGYSSKLRKIRYRSWGGKTTRAKAQLYENSCRPDCISGGFFWWNVRVRFERLRTVTCKDGHTYRAYTYETIFYKRDRPESAPDASSIGLLISPDCHV